MGYCVLGRTEDIFRGYGPRPGLEGPFLFGNGRIVYYDTRAGQYWDPTTDFYLKAEEVQMLHNQLLENLR
jgi:hypothetical protein